MVIAPGALAVVMALAGCVFIPFVPQPEPPQPGPDVQDFVFESFDATYELGRDEHGVATLTTTEHLVALFPEYDQNRGIERVLVDGVGNQDTSLEVVAVTDGAGEPIAHEVKDDGGPTVAVIMAGHEYVHGRQEYVVVYTQRNVVTETDGVEYFHWGVNGPGWSQPFARVSARVELGDGIAEGLSAESGCYVDAPVPQRHCDLVHDADVVSVAVDDVRRGESLTLHLQFAQQFEVE